jgi:hypothetical protein
MRCDRCSQITVKDLCDGCELLQQPTFVSLKSSAESGCDLCNLSYVAVTSTYDQEDIEALCQGHLPRLPDEHDTGVRLQGRFYDSMKWNEYNSKMEKVMVVVGDDLSGKNYVSTWVGIYADPGEQSGVRAGNTVTNLISRNSACKIYCWSNTIAEPG